MNLNHRIRFKREPKHEYIGKMITFGLFTHGNYPTTVFKDTN